MQKKEKTLKTKIKLKKKPKNRRRVGFKKRRRGVRTVCHPTPGHLVTHQKSRCQRRFRHMSLLFLLLLHYFPRMSWWTAAILLFILEQVLRQNSAAASRFLHQQSEKQIGPLEGDEGFIHSNEIISGICRVQPMKLCILIVNFHAEEPAVTPEHTANVWNWSEFPRSEFSSYFVSSGGGTKAIKCILGLSAFPLFEKKFPCRPHFRVCVLRSACADFYLQTKQKAITAPPLVRRGSWPAR